MQNNTIPSDKPSDGCGAQCMAFVSLACALGLMTLCFCCAVCFHLLAAEYPRQMSPFISPIDDPVVVVVQNKVPATQSQVQVQQDEDPS
jgi:hypothetical protein